jgi:DNA repair protein
MCPQGQAAFHRDKLLFTGTSCFSQEQAAFHRNKLLFTGHNRDNKLLFTETSCFSQGQAAFHRDKLLFTGTSCFSQGQAAFHSILSLVMQDSVGAGLSEEQLKRIEENRKKALLKLEETRKRKEVEALLEQSSKETESKNDSITADSNVSELHCEQEIDETGERCNAKNIDKVIYGVFGEKVCYNCKRHNKTFDLVTQSEAMTSYLLSKDCFPVLKHHTLPNPRHSAWQEMKMYLRKDLIALAVKRFGSIEALEEERKKREEKKLKRAMNEVEHDLGLISDIYNNNITSSASEVDIIRNNSTSNSGGSNVEEKKKKSKKRRILDWVASIKDDL